MSGNIATVNTREAGQPLVIEDSSGKVVLRDRGLIVQQSFVFNTLGDNKPGGEFLSGPELVRVSAPHPGLSETFDFCALAHRLIG